MNLSSEHRWDPKDNPATRRYLGVWGLTVGFLDGLVTGLVKPTSFGLVSVWFQNDGWFIRCRKKEVFCIVAYFSFDFLVCVFVWEKFG